MKWMAFALGLGCALLPATASAAPSWAVSSWLEGASSSSVGMGMGTGLALDTRKAVVTLDTRYGSDSPRRFRSGRLISSWLLEPLGPFEPEVLLVAVHRSGREEATRVRPEARLNLAGGSSGVWVSAGAEGVSEPSNGEYQRFPVLGFGVWSRRHSLTLSGSVEQSLGTLPGSLTTPAAPVPAPPDTTHPNGLPIGVGEGRDAITPRTISGPQQVMLTTAYSTLRWDGTRVEFESVAGVTVSALTAPRRWAQASLAYRLWPHLAVVASAGSRAPQVYALDPAGEHRTSVALRFSEWQSSAPRPTLAARAQISDCRLHALGAARYAIRVRAAGARRVELTGDMTQWQPIPMAFLGAGRWEAIVEMNPGLHQLNLRADGGAWLPPPGFPTAIDGFAGEVGIVVTE